MRTTTDFEEVKIEMERRDIWKAVNDMSMPNRTIAFPASLEIFYLQRSPLLAAWGQYDSLDDLNEVLNNLTLKRLCPEVA